ncbi:hypothetical protein BRD00_08785 [Halobacteriales archaeon QS_8_69_26]|nr:MAG: hypothetical protein BRD00_08785 [Halobacteriales archaeon QS_8_69_26]
MFEGVGDGRALAEAIPDGVAVHRDGAFVYVNDAAVEVLGARSREDLVGRPVASVVDVPGDDCVEESFAEVRSGERSIQRIEYSFEPSDGEVRHVEWRITTTDWQGERSLLSVIRDVTDHRRAERDLRETTQTLEALVEASPAAIIAIDVDGRVELWNPAAESIFGWSAEEVIGEPNPIVPEDRTREYDDHLERVVEGERVTGVETRRRTKSGEDVDVSLSTAAMEDGDGELVGLMAVVKDISERRERKRQLRRQNERLEQFASIVSHDLRNPIEAATGHLELLCAKHDLDGDDDVEGLATMLERMDDIVDDVLALARLGESTVETEPVSLNDVALDAWSAVGPDADAQLTVEGDAVVEADRSRLQQLLENLLRNSLEHAGPDVSVRIGLVPAGSEGNDDGATGFFVADDGPGIDPEDRDAVRERGYSTTETGAGFGLAIVEEIARAHGWSVGVTDATDGGARFEFRPEDAPRSHSGTDPTH